MSALAAVFHRDGAPVEEEAVRAMLEAQALRGPDARRTVVRESVALGHGLFATMPEDEAGLQPVVADDGAVVVMLDGRIDNREEIAGALDVALNVEGASVADVELVAKAFARWGEGFAERFAGDFAIVVWDARRRALVCARDVLGARPLYYRADARTFRVASTPLALFAGTNEAPEPSFEAIALFLVERYVERPMTLLRGVCAVPPGATLRASKAAVHMTASTWPAPIASRPLGSPREYEEQLRVTLREATRSRMRARGRIAVHLSGGIDSSSIAGLAASVARESGAPPPILMRCVFPGLSCDESRFSQAVADHLGLPLESVIMPGALTDYAPEVGRAPRGLLTNPIAKMLDRQIDRAKELGARVALTGTGSDQLLQPTGFELSAALLRGDARSVLALSGARDAPLSFAPYRRIVREGVKRALPAKVRAAARTLLGRGDGLPAWLTAAARNAVHRADDSPDARAARAAAKGMVPRDLARRRLVAQLRGDADYSFSLVMMDQIAAARGGELRHPFFDRRVIDLLLSFPNEVRAEGSPSKALLRRAMGDLLPPLVRERTDAAEFAPLIQRTLVEAHGEKLAASLREGRLAGMGLVDGEAAALVVERARADPWVLREVMMLASMELWLRGLLP